MPVRRWWLGLIVLLFIGSLAGLYALHKENQTLHQEVARLSHLISEKPVELSTFMTAYERFLTKLHAAGMNENWELAAFYLEELKETAEELEKSQVVEEGIPISAMIRPNLIEPLAELEKVLPAKDKAAFEAQLRALVQRCNGCHAAAGKPYLRFTLPAAGQPPRQIF